MQDKAEELYSILKSNGEDSYDTEWIRKNAGMSPEEINQAASILERQGKIKLHKFIGGNHPYNFSVIEVLES
jgi:predicted transcriptional regulator